MKTIQIIALAVFVMFLAYGCETANKGAAEAGKVVGKTTKVLDSVSEGAVDGYVGNKDTEENPYNR